MEGCSKGDLAIIMTDFRDSFADIVRIYWFIQRERNRPGEKKMPSDRFIQHFSSEFLILALMTIIVCSLLLID
jgi:hypothetical protein